MRFRYLLLFRNFRDKKPDSFLESKKTKFVAHAEAVERIRSDNGRILVHLTPGVEKHLREHGTAPSFLKWIGN